MGSIVEHACGFAGGGALESVPARRDLVALVSRPIDPDAEHRVVIARLSDNLNVPVDEVREIYWEQLDRLAAEARIPSFLTVLAVRNTRSVLRGACKRHTLG